jgi:serine/threonine-protein kinase
VERIAEVRRLRRLEEDETKPVVESDDSLERLSGQWLTSRYQFIKVRAHGAYSVVYDAQDVVLQRSVAIKVTTLDHADTYRAAFAASAALSYPAFIAVYDSLEEGGRLNIVQELIDGRAFSDYLVEGAPTRRAVSLALQLARALAYAHQHGMSHGDLTPSAILIDRSARAHINNTGLPPDWEYFTAVAGAAARAGLLPEPEGALAMIRDDAVARDIWAIGAMLWQLLTVELRDTSSAPDVAGVRTFRRDVALDVQDVVLRAMDVTHTLRIPTAERLALALEALDTQLNVEPDVQGGVTPIAVRAYVGRVRDVAQTPGMRRMLGQYADDRHLASTETDFGAPFVLDTSETRPADDALFSSGPRGQMESHRITASGVPRADYVTGRPAPHPLMHQGEYRAYDSQREQHTIMRGWVWTLIGVALFVAWFLVGFLVFPQFKLF